MQHLTLSHRSLIAAAIALALSFPVVAQAQQPARDTLAFKANTAGVADVFLVPVEPPVGNGRLNFKGTSDLLGGAITLIDSHYGHLAVDGTFLRSTDGVAAFIAANGDAIHIQWSGAARLSDKAGIYNFAGGFTVTGGKGRFTGATGSGIMNSVVNFNTLQVDQVWEGVVLTLKK
jgi:hypothetical protein